MEDKFLPAEFWDDLYQRGETRWDLGYASTPLKEYIDQLTNKDLRILIPGAGSSYEAVYLAENGFSNVSVIDISTLVTERLRKTISLSHPSISILTGDFFMHEGQYDLIIEQTFLCTLHPSVRNQYVKKIKALLAGNGKLAGVLFNREFDTNPPFGGNREEYRQLLSSGLRIKILEDCINSIPPRAGTELFFIAENDAGK